MSKVIDTLVQNAIDSKNYAAVILCKMECDTPVGTLRYNNSPQNIYWDDEGAGEETYSGLGNLASISVLPETNELGSITIQLTLSGIPTSILNNMFGDTYRNRPVYLWYGLVDKATYAIQGGTTGPVLVFAGLMDYSNVEFGQTATVTLSATSRLADWDKPRGGRYSDGYQRQYVDSTDDGFSFVASLQNKEINWGTFTVLDPGGGGTTTTPGDNDYRDPSKRP